MQSVSQQAKITIFKHYLIPSFTFAGDNPPTWNFCSSDCHSMCSPAIDRPPPYLLKHDSEDLPHAQQVLQDLSSFVHLFIYWGLPSNTNPPPNC